MSGSINPNDRPPAHIQSTACTPLPPSSQVFPLSLTTNPFPQQPASLQTRATIELNH